MGYTHRKVYVAKRMIKAQEYLGRVCSVCGTTEELEFDHIDPSTKVISISNAIRQECWSWNKLVIELDKCQLLCHTHHIEKSQRNKEFKGGHNKILRPAHGTAKKYGELKCRCHKCRSWKRLYRKQLVDARGNPRPL